LPDLDVYSTRRLWNFSKCFGRQTWWYGESTRMSKFLTSDLLIIFTGMRFGLMEVKTGLCHILSRFEVAPCKDTPVRIVFEPKSFVLQMQGDIRLSFNRMQFWNNIYTCTIHPRFRSNGGEDRAVPHTVPLRGGALQRHPCAYCF